MRIGHPSQRIRSLEDPVKLGNTLNAGDSIVDRNEA